MQARRPALQRPRVHWCKEHQSGLWVEQTPGHGSDLIEGLNGPVGVDDSSLSEELQVTVDLLGRCVGDPPEAQPVSPRPAVALSEIGRHGARRKIMSPGLELLPSRALPLLERIREPCRIRSILFCTLRV